MEHTTAFGHEVRDLRRALDLTQDELARRVGCAAITLRKIEAGDLRPSQQIAERLAVSLSIPPKDRAEFVRQARSVLPSDRASTPTPPLTPDEIGLPDLSGRAIRGYTLGEQIGAGSFGVVYRGVQPLVARDVAIKIIRPQYANQPDFIRRFEAEAQLVARLEHPHIVPLYDYWREPGVAYLVMRLLRGGSLRERLARGPLPLDQIARLLEQLGAALLTAHRAGVIHRDLKASNVLLDEDCNAYLADFGIARAAADVSPQIDVWALGDLVTRLLTRDDLPAAFEALCARLARQYYTDVATLLADFKQAQTGRLIDVPPMISPHPIALVNPYKGLRPFEEADAADFFGRETLTQQLLARLSDGDDLQRFLALVGPSGSGKSSVVKAGLIPALRRGALPHSEHWFVIDVLPGPHPLEEIEAALLRIAVNPPSSLLSQIREDARGLLRAIQRSLPDDDSELVLVLDQFEEVFTLVDDEAERAQLLNALVAAILAERSRVRVIATLRADFLDKPLRYVDFAELIQRRSQLVLPLTPDEIERAIVAPAQRAGVQVESGLAETIVADVIDQPGGLPLLQYALTELFEQRTDHTLTKAAYHAIGGVQGALGRRAEEIYQALSEHDQLLARQVFLRLVTLGEGTEDVRRRVARMELETLTPNPSPKRGEGGVTAVLDAFGQARLLSFDRDAQTRGPTVEVAHEALLREWSRLRDWLSESRSEVRLQRLLANEVTEWLKAERDSSFLLHGSRLQQFEEWAGTTSIALTNDERAYLEASLIEREKQRVAEEARRARESKLEQRAKRVLQGLFAVAVIAALISGALAISAVIQRNRAEAAELDARSQAGILLASQALSELDDGYSDRAVLLALESLEHYPYSSQAEHALAQAVTYNRVVHVLQGHTGAVSGAAWSPDDSQIATASADKTIRLWNAKSGQEVKRFDLDDIGVAVGWSPDGRYLVGGASDRFIYGSGSQAVKATVWDASSGKLVNRIAPVVTSTFVLTNLNTLAENFNTNQSFSFSPDSRQLAIIGGDNTARIYDLTNGQESRALVGHADLVHAVVWSHSDYRVATTCEDGTVKIWDSTSGQETLTLSGHRGPVNSVAWSPDDTQLATAGEDGTLRIWNAITGDLLKTVQADPERVWDVAWRDDRLATANADGAVRIWNASTGEQVVALRGHTRWALAVAWAHHNQELISGSHDNSVYVWKASPGSELMHFPEPTQVVSFVAWSPDSQQVIVSAGTWFQPGVIDGSVKIWDVDTGHLAATFDEQIDAAFQAEWSPNGKQILTRQVVGTELPDQEIFYLWNADTLTLSQVLTQTAWLRDASWSPDGQRVAVSRFDSTAGIYDANTGQEVIVFRGHAPGSLITSIRWSPDGKRIASTAGRNEYLTRIWNPDTGDELMKLEGHTSNVNWVGWSPDGQKLCTTSGDMETGGADKSLHIWDANTGQPIQVILGHFEGLWICGWSPNGQRVFSTSIDGTTRVWNAETGAEILRLETPTDWYLHAAWSPDGTRLATGGDGEPRIWRVWQSTEELIQYAKECCVLRELTPAERQQFGLGAK